MYNWGVDLRILKKDKVQYTIWHIEQMVNFGLNGKKLSAQLLKKYWPLLNLDPKKKRYLERMLWPRKQS